MGHPESVAHHDGGAAPAAQTFLGECYWPGVTAEGATAAAAAVACACADLRAEGVPARVMWAALMPADEAVLYWLESPGEDTVADIYRRADVAYDRVTVVVPLLPSG